MIEKRVVNFIGHPGSGKSQLCKYAARVWGAETVRPSGIIEAYAAVRGIDLSSREEYMACRDRMAKEDDAAFVAPVVQSGSSILVIDGLRVPAEVDRLRNSSAINKLAVIALHCPIEERYLGVMEHFEERGSRDRSTLEAFRADEAGDYYNPDRNSGSVLTVMREADFHVTSTPCDLVNLQSLVHPLLDEIFSS